MELLPPGPGVRELHEREIEPQVQGKEGKGPRREADKPSEEEDDPFDVLGEPPDGERLEPGPHHLGQVRAQPPVRPPYSRQHEKKDDRCRNGVADATKECFGLAGLLDLPEGRREVSDGPRTRFFRGFSGQRIEVAGGDDEHPLVADLDQEPLGDRLCRCGSPIPALDDGVDPRLCRLDALIRGVTEQGSPHGDNRAVLDFQRCRRDPRGGGTSLFCNLRPLRGRRVGRDGSGRPQEDQQGDQKQHAFHQRFIDDLVNSGKGLGSRVWV